MATHVALLRGINVGGRNKVPMAELRQVAGSLGHTGVQTYIQTGNILFDSAETDAAKLAAGLEAAITAEFGVWSSVVVLTRDELAATLADNPYRDEPNPKYVHVVFLSGPPPDELMAKIKAAEQAATAKGNRDAVTAVGHALFLHTPDGYGNSELGQAVFKIIATPARQKKTELAATARNWATATKLLAMCDEPAKG